MRYPSGQTADRLRWIACAFAGHPNQAALRSLVAAIEESARLQRALEKIEPADPESMTAVEWEQIRQIHDDALEASARIRAAALDLGVDVDAEH